MCRATSKGHYEIVKLLLKYNVDCRICKKGDHETPLHIAALKGHTKIVLLLLENNNNPNTLDQDGQSALHIATHKGYLEIVKLLLQHKCDPHASNKEKESRCLSHHKMVILIL